MSHPEQEFIDQFRFAVERLAPLTPKDILVEAENLIDELESEESTSAEQIRQAMVFVGRKEFPYRKAYQELCAGDEEQRLQQIVLDKLDDAIKEQMEAVSKYGVHILDYIKSSQFDELPHDVQTNIDNAVREAHDILNEQCDDRAHQRQADFEKLVSEWKTKTDKIQTMINVLRELSERDEQYKADIIAKVNEFENGWSMIDLDPTEEDVQREIDYWLPLVSEREDEEGLED